MVSGVPVRELDAPRAGDSYLQNVWAQPTPTRDDLTGSERAELDVVMTLGIDLACRAAHVASLAGTDGRLVW